MRPVLVRVPRANGAECGAEDFGPIDTEGASVIAHDDVEGAVFGGAAAE